MTISQFISRVVLCEMVDSSWCGGIHAQLVEIFRAYRHYNLQLLVVWEKEVPATVRKSSDILSMLSIGKEYDFGSFLKTKERQNHNQGI